MHSQDSVHRELTDLYQQAGGLLHAPHPELKEFLLHPDSFHEILNEYALSLPDGPSEGRAAIITAGPPGAGKSYAMDGMDLSRYLRIDADDIKDLILVKAELNGFLDARLTYILSDGRPVGLREMAGLVHELSTKVSDRARVDSLRDGRNIVIEGTLGWDGIVQQHRDEFTNRGYDEVVIFDVEAPREQVLKQARSRWWKGRLSEDPMGGRFVPDSVVTSSFNPDGTTRCTANARRLQHELEAVVGASTLLEFQWQPAGPPLETSVVGPPVSFGSHRVEFPSPSSFALSRESELPTLAPAPGGSSEFCGKLTGPRKTSCRRRGHCPYH